MDDILDSLPDKGLLDSLPDQGNTPSTWDTVKKKASQFFNGRTEIANPDNPSEVRKIKGPDLMEIPGVGKLADIIKEKGIQSGDYWKGFGGSVASDILKMGASGVDPRAAIVGKAPEIRPRFGVPDSLQPPPAPRPPLGLPSAPFIAGDAGIADPARTYANNTNVLSHDTVAKYGLDLGEGRPLPDVVAGSKAKDVKINKLLPGDQIKVGSDIVKVPPKQDYNIGAISQLDEDGKVIAPQPSAEQVPRNTKIKLRNNLNPEGKQIPLESKPSVLDTLPDATEGPQGQVKTNGKPISNNAQVDSKSAEGAVYDWANRREGAAYKANLAKQRFGDLTDPSLVDKYEVGDRTGRLADVEAFLNQRLKEGQDTGIFGKEQARPNYLRHEFNEGSDVQQAAVKNYVGKNPSIAKTGKFPTYAEAEATGKLTRKYTTIPEMIASYEKKFHTAQANKAFYDYLNETKQIPKGGVVSSPDTWMNNFQGPNAKLLAEKVGNYQGRSPEGLNKLANAFSWTKNLALGSGIPKTPLNMHMYNITRSDIMARGIKEGLGDFVSGVFNPSRDVKTIEQHADLIGDLIDHGMGWSNIEDHAALGSGGTDATKGVFGKALGKVTDFQTKVFEDPLFQRHLPAVKVRMAAQRVEELTPKIGREAALKQAATEANDFYGGINKVLRNKTYKDLSRIGLLAPDWLESRLNIGVKGAKALVGKADPLYAKALGRRVGMRVAGAGATAGVTGSLLNPSNKGSNSTNIPAGQTATGKNREVPILGSAAEDIRLPEDIIKSLSEGNGAKDTAGIVSSRLSMPLRAGANVVLNRDDFGSPLYGKDRYGKDISGTQGVINAGKQVANVVTPPWLTMLYQLLAPGKNSDTEANIARGLELPVNYNSEEKDGKKPSNGIPRIRMPR